jgi:hypothetical protein
MTARSPPRRFGFVKLPGASKRWRNESNPDFARDATISDRKMSDLAREERLGEKTTKEQYQRGVIERRYRYADERTETRQRHATVGREIRKEIPEITPADAAIIVKFRTEGGYEALTDEEKERFDRLFKRYPKESVREALGSPAKRRSARRKRNNERTIWRAQAPRGQRRRKRA